MKPWVGFAGVCTHLEFVLRDCNRLMCSQRSSHRQEIRGRWQRMFRKMFLALEHKYADWKLFQ